MKKINKLIIFSLIIIGSIIMSVFIIKDFIFKRPYLEIVEKYSLEYNVDKNFIYSIMKAESNFDKNALSKKQAKGLMQILDTTGEWAASEIGIDTKDYDLFDPDINIRIGIWYINILQKQFSEKDSVIAAYNAGPGNVSKWLSSKDYSNNGTSLQNIPFAETKKYREKVNNFIKIYDFIYNE